MFFEKILNFMNLNNWVDGKYYNPSELEYNELLEETEIQDNSSHFPLLDCEKQHSLVEIPEKAQAPSLQKQDTDTIECFKPCFSEDVELPYMSSKIIIEGLNFYFISVARDIVSRNNVDELLIKRSYNIDSNAYDVIIQQLKDAKIIDNSNNILMSSDSLEHFFDIYQPKLFHCPHSNFDKDIFICLGEILIENGIDYAKECFSSIDELLDYLIIMEKLNVIQFQNGKYDIVCSIDDFHDICKGVPEYYSTFENARQSSSILSSIDYDLLSGSEFEKFCADLLIRNGFENVSTTKSSGDHGVDIFAEKDNNTYAIQCKCYSSNVGNSAVQEILSGKKLYRKDIAVVLTNRYFTTQAKEEATALNVKLWDRDKLNELIQKSLQEKREL